MVKTKESQIPTESEVIRSGSCLSLSGATKLTYEFAATKKAGLMVRVSGSSGKGSYTKDWVPMQGVQRILAKQGDNPITLTSLHPLYRGRSINSAGFLLAVLLHVGLVERSKDLARGYQPLPGERFFEGLRLPKGFGEGAKSSTFSESS